MGIRFRFNAAGTQRVYKFLKIVLKLVFPEMTKFKINYLSLIKLCLACPKQNPAVNASDDCLLLAK